MLQPSKITPEDLGEELAEIIPGQDPELISSIRRIPISQWDLNSSIIPVCEPVLSGNEKRYVLDCLDSNWISSAGKYIRMFEEQFAAECGCKYGTACCNGTVALHLGLAALGLEPEDEVILPTFTMIATINAVRYVGATPVLIDSEAETWNMDVNQLADKITPRTKVIMPVHTYGHPVDMDPVMELADKHGIFVMEDAAEAHGAEYKGRRTGGLGHAAGFSFYANKIITTGEGGIITTNDAEFATLTHNLRDHAFSHERHFWHKYVGYNYRMTNLQAAVGVAQTEQLNDFVEMRRRNAALYTALLRDIPGVITPPEKEWGKNVFWMYSILIDEEKFGMTRDEIRGYLAKRGIETRTFFIPLHLQPVYFETFKGQRFPVSEMLCQKGFYLPSASSLTTDQVKYIVDVMRQAYQDATGE